MKIKLEAGVWAGVINPSGLCLAGLACSCGGLAASQEQAGAGHHISKWGSYTPCWVKVAGGAARLEPVELVCEGSWVGVATTRAHGVGFAQGLGVEERSGTGAGSMQEGFS